MLPLCNKPYSVPSCRTWHTPGSRYSNCRSSDPIEAEGGRKLIAFRDLLCNGPVIGRGRKVNQRVTQKQLWR